MWFLVRSTNQLRPLVDVDHASIVVATTKHALQRMLQLATLIAVDIDPMPVHTVALTLASSSRSPVDACLGAIIRHFMRGDLGLVSNIE
jgi:hypothetical protein